MLMHNSHDLDKVTKGSRAGAASSNTSRETCAGSAFDHGEQCSCLVLAAAVGANPKSISFDYCHSVLQKHWAVRCRHGQHPPVEPAVLGGERWRDIGKIDPVKVLLIREG